MGDNYTEVTTESWGERLKNSIGGVVGGIILFILSFVVLFVNEGRSVKTIRALNEMGKNAITISADSADAANEGKLVHLNGNATTGDVLTDPVFAVSGPAIKLVRNVEMYQWKENVKTTTVEKTGGKKETKKEYSYVKAWSSSYLDSSSFKIQDGHMNPPMSYEGTTQTATNVTVGAFTLNPSQISSISGQEALAVSEENLKQLPADLQAITKVSGDGFYIGANPSAPEIGDYKVSFQIITPGKDISLIAAQQGNTFKAYTAKNGKQMQLTQMGTLSIDEMITAGLKSNQMMTWILRLVGFLMMFGGLQLIFKPLSTLGAVLPILGNLIEMGTSLVAGLISIALTSLTIAIAWIFFRPLIGILLLLVTAGAIGALVYFRMQKGKPAREAA